MNFFEEVKEIINEYQEYKRQVGSKALSTQNSRKRNLFSYIEAKNLGRKYGNELYKHFKIMHNVENYELLINLFGKNNILRALDGQKTTTAEIAEELFRANNIEDFNKEFQGNYRMKEFVGYVNFNRATGLELSQREGRGIDPICFARGAFNGKTMNEILRENNVTKEILKKIYDIYGKEIVECYNNDSYLRNKTVLKTDDKYKSAATVGGLQDHITYYSDDDLNRIFEKYFKNETLSDTEYYIIIGLIAKETDLIGLYSLKALTEKTEYIKDEINVGIFNSIVLEGKEYANGEREKIVELSRVWNEEDLNRYNNLALLKQRLGALLPDKNISDRINAIDEILVKSLDEVVNEGKKISEFMDSIFTEYEILNRNNIIQRVYSPEKSQDVVITDLAQMGSGAMLHFFDPNRTMMKFDEYVADLEQKRSEEIGKTFKFSEEEKKAMLLQYRAKENHYIADYSLDFEGIGQVGSFDARYVTNVSNQLSSMVITPEEIFSRKCNKRKSSTRIFKRYIKSRTYYYCF